MGNTYVTIRAFLFVIIKQLVLLLRTKMMAEVGLVVHNK
jgi:hypothetical protein